MVIFFRSRCKYSSTSNDWQVGVNYLHSNPGGGTEDGIWFSFPDVAASIILTGKCPKIIDAFRIEADGKLGNMKSIRLRGEIPVDPSKEDFFRVVIEQRKKLGSRQLSECEKERLDRALKVLANSASYGIYAEMNAKESDQKVSISCHGIDHEPFECRVKSPEERGPYCFPPLASLITGAARLMLALLEQNVTAMGGTYAMEDTDSMAIVATKKGGIVPCGGGLYRTKDGQEGIKALSWEQVDQIVKRFESLNPYQHNAIPGSVLKIEEVNFDHTYEKATVNLLLCDLGKTLCAVSEERKRRTGTFAKGCEQ